MTIVPERREARAGVRSAINAQFWGQQVATPSDLSGVAILPPGELAPVPLARPSGVSRSQQMLLAQRMGDLPCMPALAAEDGGIVLDRTLVSAGRGWWWGTIVGRLRAQRAWGQLRQGLRHTDVLGDVENYALGARGVARLPGDVKVSGSVRVGRADDAVKLLGALQRRLGRRSGGEGPAKCSGRVAVKSPDVLGHTLEASASFGERLVSHSSAAHLAPESLYMVDLRPAHRRSGVTYRVGAVRAVERGRVGAQTLLQGAVATESSVTLLGGGKAPSAPQASVKRTTSVPLGTDALPRLQDNGSSDPGELQLEQDVLPRKRAFPFSAFAPRPHLAVGGSWGLTVGTPLSGGAPEHQQVVPQPTSPNVMSRALKVVRTASNLLRDRVTASTARVFASGMVSAQVGNFSRPFLDFTSVCLRADVGLPAPLLPPGSPARLPVDMDLVTGKLATAVTLDVCQQVWGPVRLRGNLRWVMEEPEAPPNNGAAHDAVARARRGVNTPARFSSTGARLLRTVSSISGLGVRRGVEPTLADLALGVDVALPNTGGAGRVVMWYSHRRREAMAELRLM